MVTRPVVQWTAILSGGFALLAVIFVLGYAMVALPLLILLLAMAGGALLYWIKGE